MEEKVSFEITESLVLKSDLGTFEGFNFRNQSAIPRALTVYEVISWNHDLLGEAEFWPSGDRAEVKVLFPRNVTGSELLALDRLLDELGGDSEENFLRIHFALSSCGKDLAELTEAEIEDSSPQIFFGECFTDARREAAYELFEIYYPEAYQAWEKGTCDGLIFDADRFLDSPAWSVEEVKLGASRVAVLVAPQ